MLGTHKMWALYIGGLYTMLYGGLITWKVYSWGSLKCLKQVVTLESHLL